jgi:hypothetical protein
MAEPRGIVIGEVVGGVSVAELFGLIKTLGLPMGRKYCRGFGVF